jgi:hypothetical protein
MRLEELDVERINVVSRDGRLRLVISCPERVPDPVVNGQTFRRNGGGGGLIFHNSEGDECGGLAFDGRRSDDGYTAGAGLMFDQFRQDQVVGLVYSDENGRRSSGLHVWERPTLPVTEPAGRSSVPRAFVGRTRTGEVAVILNDSQGKPRIRMRGDESNTARLEFLDAEGRVTFALPPADGA